MKARCCLPLTVSVPTSAKPGESITLKGKAEWSSASDVCIRKRARSPVTLPVGDKGHGCPTGTGGSALRGSPRRAAGRCQCLEDHAVRRPAPRARSLATAPVGAGTLSGLMFPVQNRSAIRRCSRLYRTDAATPSNSSWWTTPSWPTVFPVVLAGVGAPSAPGVSPRDHAGNGRDDCFCVTRRRRRACIDGRGRRCSGQ